MSDAATIREALALLRFSNAQPNLGAAWKSKDALAALDDLEARVEDLEAALRRTIEHMGETRYVVDYARGVLDLDTTLSGSVAPPTEETRCERSTS